jgi:hypothetical protein
MSLFPVRTSFFPSSTDTPPTPTAESKPHSDYQSEVVDTGRPLTDFLTNHSRHHKNGNHAHRRHTAPLAPKLAHGVGPGGNSVFASAELLSGRDAKTGIELDVLTVSGQAGLQNEAGGSVVTVGLSTDEGHSHIHGELLTARAHAGMFNADGSVGLNAGANAKLAGIEGTLEHSGWSLTGGLHKGIGGGGSIGLRDLDCDGKIELAFKADVMFFTLGAAVELPFKLPF